MNNGSHKIEIIQYMKHYFQFVLSCLSDNCPDKYSHHFFFQTQIKVPQAGYEEIDHNHLWRLVIDVMKGCCRGNILSK